MSSSEVFQVAAAAIASVGVGGGFVCALSSWLGRVWASRILEQDRAKYQERLDALRREGEIVLERLRTAGAKDIFVHRVQFEKEFQIYGELWDHLITLGRAAAKFRALRNAPDPGATADQELAELRDAYNAYSDLVYRRRPFYAPVVYDLAKETLHLASDVNDWATWAGPHSSTDKQEDAKGAALDRINELVNTICEAIRARIWSTPIGVLVEGRR